MISDGRIGCRDQLHRQRAGFLRRAQPVGVHRRDRAMAQRHHAQRLGDAGHGGGGAHHAAGAGGGGEPALDLADPFGGDAAGAIRRPVAAAVGAGGQPLALVRRRQHRPGDQLHRRDVGRGGGHQLRRHGLVAAADQHRGVHRLRGQHRLGVERGEVAVVHRGREQRRLAQRHGGERQRQPAGGQHAALHRLDQFGDGAVAVVEAGAGVDDADHRADPASPANSPSTWRTTGADRARSRDRRSWRCCGPGRVWVRVLRSCGRTPSWPGLSRPSVAAVCRDDGRDKPGHDGWGRRAWR